MATKSFLDRLKDPRPILLDGATGTELTRRGVDTRLPLWSARALVEAPETVLAIHRDYVAAGSEVITTNTFRTHRRSLAQGGLGAEAGPLTRLAVRLAHEAARDARGRVFVAGSMSPLEDCFRPDLVPGDAALVSEHRYMAKRLADAGVDLLLVEMMSTVRECWVATAAAKETGLPVLSSLLTGVTSHLFSGEPVASAVNTLLPLEPEGLLVNCVPARRVSDALGALIEAVLSTDTPAASDMSERLPLLPAGILPEGTYIPARDPASLGATVGGRVRIGAYGNIGHADDVNGWAPDSEVPPDEYARLAAEWLAAGASIVGGCCGTTPAHVAALIRIVTRNDRARG